MNSFASAIKAERGDENQAKVCFLLVIFCFDNLNIFLLCSGT